MPSIIPSPGSPGIEPNFFETVYLAAPYTVAEGTTYFTTALELMYVRRDYSDTNEYLDFDATLFVNHGTLWNRSKSYVGTIISSQNFSHITNTGLMVSEAPAGQGQAHTIEVRGAFGGLTNSGRIYAISYDLRAATVQDWAGSGTGIVNSGLIAAQMVATLGPDDFAYPAIAITRNNGGLVFNAESGAILAEGPRAYAVWLGRGHITPPGWSEGPDIENYGRIEAVATDARFESVGLRFESLWLEKAIVVNGGTIKADIAILFEVLGGTTDDPQQAKTVTNLAGGLIDGAVILSAFNETILNYGTIHGDVAADAGDDFIRNSGRMTGVVDLGEGSDHYDGLGALGAANVRGGGGMDLILGGAAGDRLEGGDGSDWIVGGNGADRLVGGPGADRFVIAAAADSPASAVDTIEDFQSGADLIDLSAIAPTSVNLSASGGITTVTAETSAGTVVIRVQGSVTLADLIVAPPGSVRTGTAAGEILYAGGGAAELRGAGGDDLLVGSSGNDLLDGGNGADVMRGGAGNDIYVVDFSDVLASKHDRVVELEGEGVDEVRTSVQYQLPDGVENLTFTGASGIRVEGNGLANVMRGNGADNILSGGAGDDILIGGAGSDSLEGLEGADRFVYTAVGDSTAASLDNLFGFESGIDKIDLTALGVTSVSWTEHSRNDGISIEHYNMVTVETPAGAMTIRVSGALAMSDFVLVAGRELVGTAGADHLSGGAGDDSLDGGGGNDVLEGGAGDDKLIGGAGVDTASYASAGAGVTLSLAVANGQNTGGAGTDILSGIENLVGSVHADALTGNALANLIDGGPGADQLVGGLGNDVYVVDNALDSVAESAGGGVDTVQSSASFTLGAELENLTLTGAGAINGTGNGLANAITGNDGANRLDGLGGADQMAGGLGSDVYTVDAGDTVTEAANAGTDEVRTALAAYTLAANVENLTGLAATGQALTGNALANILTGGGGNDVLNGGTGADKLRGGLGNDVYFIDDAGDAIADTGGVDEVRTSLADTTAAAGIENLTGISGAGQILRGNSLNNLIAGGAGADQMRGGLSSDIYIVGAGDVVTENAGEGTDEVRSALGSYTLTANVERLTGTSASGQTLTGNTLANVVTGGVGNDKIDGGLGADQLAGGLGSDLYTVDAGDIVTEAAGAGTDEVRTALAAYALGANLENLTGLAAAGQALTGNALANILTGDGGNDVLNGGGGADKLRGGLGNDVYFIDNAGDAVADTGGLDEVRTSLADTTAAAGIENLTGISGAGQILRGNSLNNLIAGGAGADQMIGGLSSDVYIVGSGDTVIENAGQGIDEVRTALASYTLGANLEKLTGLAASGQILTGNALANVVTGGAGNDKLDGGLAADQLAGGLGNDLYTVDAGDTVTEAAGAGMDEVRTALAAYTLSANVENLTGLAASGQSLTGNGLANALTGAGGNDVLNGGGGADKLKGGAGNDVYFIDDAGDVAFDTGGIDEIRTSLADTTAGAGIENLTGILGAGQILRGNSLNNLISGGAGADQMIGGTSSDVYIVGSGDTVTENAGEGIDEVRTALGTYTLGANLENLTGLSAGAQTLTGNALNNVIDGGAGNNRIVGGAGNDTLSGGAGLDDFWFDTAPNAATNVDRILDFVAADDRLVLDRSIFAAVNGGTLAAGAFYAGTAAHDADDRIVYDSATGKIFYDADGSGAGAALLFAQVDAGTVLTNADFYGA